MAWRARSHTARTVELRALASIALLTLALAGCGSSDDGDQAGPDNSDEVIDISGAGPVGEVLGGSVAPLVECRDWNQATDAQKLATIEQVRDQEANENPGVEVPELTDEEANELFDQACEPSYAGGFRLYKLYAQGAAFLPLKRALEEGE